jgi:putative acetyltransferase
MEIITAQKQDAETIRQIHLSAFPEGEGNAVSELAVNLLSEKTNPAVMSLLAKYDNEAVGHIAYSPVRIESDKNWQGYILAPLAVKPEHQKHGIGLKLIQYGMRELKESGVNVLFVYGDPKYYSRFGFDTETATHYAAPYDLEHPFGWQAIVLNESNIVKTPVKISCVNSLHRPELW